MRGGNGTVDVLPCAAQFVSDLLAHIILHLRRTRLDSRFLSSS